MVLGMGVTLPALGAAVSLGLSGSASNNNLGLETSHNNAVAANLNLDLSVYFRVGVTHRRSIDTGEGFKRLKDSAGAEQYVEFESQTRTITNSVDLIVVLYNGVISPYVFGGVAKKEYSTSTSCAALCTENPGSVTLFPVPNYGFGAGISLNKEFSLKISQTYSPGVATVLENGFPASEEGVLKTRYVRDSYTQIGISYHL